MPSIVLGELYYGARNSNRVIENIARVDELATRCSILACDLDTAKQYSSIKHMLRKKGRPIPENDLWIAAIAHQHDLILVTRDEHFTEIDEVYTETW